MGILTKIAPHQWKGAKSGASAHFKCSSVMAAQKLYQEASGRLLSINKWGRFSGDAGVEFCLTDKNATPILNAIPQTGNLIRIKLPAPGNKAGRGYDWVRIEEIESLDAMSEKYQSLSIRVRPVHHPKNGVEGETAHFYTENATSTFAIIRKDSSVWAIELGRNESPNMHVSLFNSLRNFVISIGARLGMAKIKWKSLMNGLLNYQA